MEERLKEDLRLSVFPEDYSLGICLLRRIGG